MIACKSVTNIYDVIIFVLCSEKEDFNTAGHQSQQPVQHYQQSKTTGVKTRPKAVSTLGF